MTIAEMQLQFKIDVDKVDSFNSDLFEPEEIDVLLNTAMYELIKQATIEGIEETETKANMLSTLKTTINLNTFQVNNPLINLPNGYFINLPDNYLKTIREECIFNTTDCHGSAITERRTVVPITDDRVLNGLENPFIKPDKKYCLRLVHTKDYTNTTTGIHEIVTNDVMPNWYLLTYYRLPTPMKYGSEYVTPSADVDCELNIEAQYWIIEEAVKQALLDIESQRYMAKEKEQEKLKY